MRPTELIDARLFLLGLAGLALWAGCPDKQEVGAPRGAPAKKVAAPARAPTPKAAVKQPDRPDRPPPPAELANRWLAITSVHKIRGENLVQTTDYAGLTPGLFIGIAGAFTDPAAARARCKGHQGCRVRFAGDKYEPVTLKEARAAARKLARGRFGFARAVTLRGRKVPLVIRQRVLGGEDDPKEHKDRTAILFWSKTGRVLSRMTPEDSYMECGAFELSEAPPGLTVVRSRCDAVSCGAFCSNELDVVAISHDNLYETVSFQDSWDRVVSANPEYQEMKQAPSSVICKALLHFDGPMQVPTVSYKGGTPVHALVKRSGLLRFQGGHLCLPPAEKGAPAGPVVLHPDQPPTPCAPEAKIKDDRPWTILALSAPICDGQKSVRRAQRLVARLHRQGFAAAKVIPSMAFSTFRCCYLTVIVDRFKTRDEAKVVARLLKKKGFSAYPKRGF